MASKSRDAEIAVLQTQMEEVKATGGRIEGKVDGLITRFDNALSSFVTQEQLKTLEENFSNDLKRARNFNWITHTLSAILGAFLIAIAYWIIYLLVIKK